MDSEGSYVYAFVGNTRRGSGIFFLCFREEGHEFLDGRHRNVASVISCKQSLAFEVEEEDCGGHGELLGLCRVVWSLVKGVFD